MGHAMIENCSAQGPDGLAPANFLWKATKASRIQSRLPFNVQPGVLSSKVCQYSLPA
ncbi:hypothetical protein RLIN73S_04184 [Rhodanobacter lindaniclasticus]